MALPGVHGVFTPRAPAPSAVRLVPPMTPRSAGIVFVDDLPGGAEWARTTDRMEQQEPALRAAIDRVVSSVMEGIPVFRAGRSTPAAQMYADHMRQACGVGVDATGNPYRRGYLRTPFATIIERAARGIVKRGWASFDVGPPRLQTDGLMYPWGIYELDAAGLAPNPWVEAQEYGYLGDGRVHRVEVVPKDLVGIRYLSGRNGEVGVAEGHRGLHFRLEARAADWEGGHGLLRPCYFWWQLASAVAEILGIASERYGTGIPVVREDYQAARDANISPAKHRQTVDDLLVVAQALAVGEEAAMVRTPSAWIEMFEGGFDPERLVKVHQHCLEQMNRAFALDLLTLANTGGGSYNLGQTLTNSFTALVAKIGGRIADTINGSEPFQGALYACLQFSFGAIDPADVPVFELAGLRETRFSDHLALLVNMLATDIPTTHPRIWAQTAAATHYDMRDVEQIVAEAQQLAGGLSSVSPPVGPRPVLPNLDPSSGGVPRAPHRLQAIVDHFQGRRGVQAVADNGPEPGVPVAAYVGSNREAAATLNITPARLNGWVRRAEAAGVRTPAIGAGMHRRWDLSRLPEWWDEATQKGAA